MPLSSFLNHKRNELIESVEIISIDKDWILSIQINANYEKQTIINMNLSALKLYGLFKNRKLDKPIHFVVFYVNTITRNLIKELNTLFKITNKFELNNSTKTSLELPMRLKHFTSSNNSIPVYLDINTCFPITFEKFA